MLTSRYFPAPSFTVENEITPRLNPVAMLNVSGVASMVINAGNASVKSAHLTCAMDCVINAPTRIRAGAVAKPGMEVDKQECKDDLQQSQVHGATEIQLQKRARGLRHGDQARWPRSYSTDDPEQ